MENDHVSENSSSNEIPQEKKEEEKSNESPVVKKTLSRFRASNPPQKSKAYITKVKKAKCGSCGRRKR